MVSDINDDEIVLCSICNNTDPPQTSDEPETGKNNDIEKSNDNANGPKIKWIGCDRCSNWVHEICDLRDDENKTIEIYYCPECRMGGKQIVYQSNEKDSVHDETEDTHEHDISKLSQTMEKLNLTNHEPNEDNQNGKSNATNKHIIQGKSTKSPHVKIRKLKIPKNKVRRLKDKKKQTKSSRSLSRRPQTTTQK